MVDLHRLASTIAAMIGAGISGEKAAMRAADLLVAAMSGAGGEPGRPTEFWQVDHLIGGEALAKLGEVLPTGQAGQLAAAVIAAMAAVDEAGALVIWGDVLASLDDRLPANAADAAAELIVAALAATVAELSSGDEAPDTAAALARALASTLGDLNLLSTRAPLGRAAELVINVMVETDDAHDLANLCSALTKLGDAVPQAVVERAVDRLLVIMAKPCDRLPTGELVEALKWPVVRGEAEAIILAVLETRTGASFDGRRSAFIRQAEPLGFTDLDSPVRRPVAPSSAR